MSRPKTPSDALAAIAGSLYRLELSSKISAADLEAWLTEASDQLLREDEEQNGHPEWLLAPAELFAAVEIASIPSWPPVSPANVSEFTSYVRILQALDRWHQPIVPSREAERLPKLVSHFEAEDRLYTNGCYGAAETGEIVAGCAWGHIPEDSLEPNIGTNPLALDPLSPIPTASQPMVLRSLLDATAFLPRSLPTGEAHNGVPPDVRVRYIIHTGQTSLPQREADTPVKIAVAPLLEAEEDAELRLNYRGDGYGIHPRFPTERIAGVIRAALHERAELLFIPECAIHSRDLERVKSELLEAGRDYFRANGLLPSLRYVFAGISEPPKGDDELGANYCVILDEMGREISRQSKLFRWDLDQDQIRRYGLDTDLGVTSVELREQIDVGREVVVVDLKTLGRVVTLICADVNANSPGDWLLTQVRTDWLNAPIFDKSVCWTFDERGLAGPWITRRAHRAAYAARCRVVVSNSMALTSRLNRTNKRAGDSRIFERCGIGILLDGRRETVEFRQLMVPVEGATPVLIAEVWGDGWSSG